MNKLQYLLINHLEKHGNVKLLLPDNVVLEIGVNQLNDDGELIKVDNYCWVMATRNDRTTILDSYNLGLRFSQENDSIVFEDEFIDNEGKKVKILDVV